MVAHAQPLRKERWERSAQLVVAQCNNQLAQVAHHLHKTCTRSAYGTHANVQTHFGQIGDRMTCTMNTHLISICGLPSRHLLGKEETS